MWSLFLNGKDLQDREVRMFTATDSHFLSDGGLFVYFRNLCQKYGMLPSNVFNRSYNSMTSSSMNETLISVLNHFALEIFNNKDNWTRKVFERKKDQYNKTIYDLVVRFLGEPPKPTDKFTWTYKTESGETQMVSNMTAQKFYRTIIPHEHETKITIINDPRNSQTYFQKSYVEYSLNMQGGSPLTMINLPLDVFKQAIYNSLNNSESCWFACDVGKCLDMENNTSDTKRFDYKSVLGTDVEFPKSDMLNMLTSVPTHAMAFNGVDAEEDEEGNVTTYRKWRVENSWGSNTDDIDATPDHGFHRMTDDYFDKYVYMAVVDLKYFDEIVLEKIMEQARKGNTFTYKYTDAFGCVALTKTCEHCKKYQKRPGVNGMFCKKH